MAYDILQALDPRAISNLEAEISVLTAIIYDNNLMDKCTDLQPSDFFKLEHQTIFRAMQKLYEAGKPIDLITLKEASGLPTEVLFTLSESFTSASTLDYHKKVIINNANRRNIIAYCKSLIDEAADPQKNAEILLEKAEQELSTIKDKRLDTQKLDTIRNTVLSVYSQIDERMHNPGRLVGIGTGYIDIDRMIGGLEKQKLYYLGARPSMGKTALAIQIATNVAKKNHPVLIVSLEMSKEQLVQRMLAQESRIPLENIRDGLLSDSDMAKVLEASNILHNLPIVFYDTSGISAAQIKPIAKKVKREMGGLGLIVIDYLQYLSGKAESKRIEVENNSKMLKQIAKEFDVPVLCLSQLSRGCETRNDKRPILSDLRETGGIEQDADMVAFLYRDEYYDPDSDAKNIAEFIIRKNRDGSLGTVNLVWIAQFTAFYSLESRREGY